MTNGLPRVLLAWEGGAGRGHLVTLKAVATALQGHAICDAALCDTRFAHEIAPLCDLAFPGALLPYDQSARRDPATPRTATWGEYLGDVGFRDGPFLRRQVEWWLDTLQSRAAQLVIGDYAPCALMAARIAGIPALAVGTGYGLPPMGLNAFPSFLPEFTERLYNETSMVETVNAALGPLGLPTLAALPDVYHRQASLVRTLPMLDPYVDQRTEAYLPPVPAISGAKASGGDEVFVYFSAAELEHPGLVDALVTLDAPVRAFLPTASPDVAARLSQAGITLELNPVSRDDVLRRSRLIVSSGQHGTLCVGLAAGIPMICIPQHMEQLYHARRAEQAGVARVISKAALDAGQMAQMCMDIYSNEMIRSTARNLAEQIAPLLSGDATGMIRNAVSSALGEIAL